MTNYWSLGDRGYTPFVGGTNVWTFSDSLDMIRGNHDIRIGGMYRANQLNTVAVGFPNGFWVVGGLTGDAAADLLTGQTVTRHHDQEFDGGNTGRRWKLYRPFIEDTWRVGKSLTLNLGLAWALVTPISEVANRQADFNPANGQFLIAGQNAGPSAGINMDLTALGAARGRCLEAVRQQHRVSRRLRNLPRFLLEPGRARAVAKSALLRRNPSAVRNPHVGGISES